MRAARAAGDRDLARTLAQLRRPTLGAWYVNTAVRATLVSVHEWFTLGRDLRSAMADGDIEAVRALSARRTPLENRVVNDLRAHLRTQGVSVSEDALNEVRTTLRAALADATTAETVATGRLTTALTYAGFGEVLLPPGSVAPNPEPIDETALPDEATLKRARERQRLDEQVRDTEAAVAALQTEATASERSVADLEARIAVLTDRLRAARESLGYRKSEAATISRRLVEARRRHDNALRDRRALGDADA